MQNKKRKLYVLPLSTILFLFLISIGNSISAQYTSWSDPASWDDGTVPVAGEMVMIPSHRKILLDVSPPPLAGMHVEGKLKFAEQDIILSADFIMITGEFRIGDPTAPYDHKAVITLTGDPEVTEGMGSRFIAVLDGGKLRMHGHRREAVSWTQLAGHAAKGKKKITVADEVDWRSGDEIVIAPSGTNPFHAETVTISNVVGNTIFFSTPLSFHHFGAIQNLNGVEVDQRAEVGLLTRDIVIQGDESSESTGIGGHIMAMPGGSMQIEGVELFKMGQKSRQARYPIHWHFAGIANGDYARDNSVHHSYHRAFVIHQTRGVQLKDNVAYDVNSHAYVIAEDGNEEDNIVIGNLGILIKRFEDDEFAFLNPDASGNSTQSENHPGVFWMRNPNNIFQGNHAVGAYNGIGFFFDGTGTATSVNPNFFSGNTAHSNYSYEGGWDRAFYRTKGHGLFVSSDGIPGQVMEFKNFNSYKNTVSGVWIENEDHILSNSLMCDNGAGVILLKSTLKNSTIIGQTLNTIANSLKDYGGINIFTNMPQEKAPIIDNVLIMRQIVGIYYQQDMIGLPASAKNVSFFNVNRNFYFAEDFLNGAFKDLDGCLSGTPSFLFPKNYPYLANSCYYDETLNANVCSPNDYYLLDIYSNNNADVIGDVRITERSSLEDLELFTYRLINNYEDDFDHQKYNYVQRNKRYDIDFYDSGIPNRFFLELSGNAAGWAYFKIDYPLGYGVEIYLPNGSLISPKNSLEALSPSQSAYYYDQESQELHIIINLNSAIDFSQAIMIKKVSLRTAETGLEEALSFSRAFPNPFRDELYIDFELPEATLVSLELFDLRGKRVSIINNNSCEAGLNRIQVPTEDLASGIYYYRLMGDDFQASGKVMRN